MPSPSVEVSVKPQSRSVQVTLNEALGATLAAGPDTNSTCRDGPAPGDALYDVATRPPAPERMNASELPCTQPGRLTISSIIGAMSPVR